MDLANCRKALWIALFVTLVVMGRTDAATVADLVGQFSATNYYDLVANQLPTRQGANRVAVTGAQHNACRDAIYTQFQAAGLTPVMDYFTFRDSNNVARTGANIIAVQPGVQNFNNEVYVVGGHYDSKSNPGADDNASGVACILEMARIFAPCNFARTIVYCAFDGEEIYDYSGAHRLGSLRFVDQHRGDNIKGMISVDMIAWQAAGANANQAYIEGRPACSAIRNDFAVAMQTHGDGLLPVLPSRTGDYSDHVAFADAGFQACLLIEAYWSSNPNYHKSTDYVELPGYIDWVYVGKMCRSVIGYYATKLQPVETTPRAVAISREPGGPATVRFTGLAGCQYAIESCGDLRLNHWTSLRTNAASMGDGSFGLTDTRASDGGSEFYRARFVAGYTNPAAVADIIIDNPAANVVGTWSTGTSSADKYGSNYRFANMGTGDAYVEYRPNILSPGNYNVYEWHPEGTNRATDAPIEINHGSGLAVVSLNQQINGGRWVMLGNFQFAAGTNGFVRIKNNFTGGSVVMADALRFSLAP